MKRERKYEGSYREESANIKEHRDKKSANMRELKGAQKSYSIE